MKLTAELAQCPECQQALLMLNGKLQVDVTFWTKDGVPMMTPHTKECSMRRRPLHA